MNTSLFHRRRAERFAQLIEETSGGGRHHPRVGADDDLTKLVALTRRVSDLPMTVEAHPEFREGLRAVLMATIEREGIGVTAKPETKPEKESLLAAAAAQAERRRARRRTRAFGAIVAGLAASALALSGVSAASGDALPGDALYGFKRSTERAQLAMTGSDIDRGQLYLNFARTRLDEAKAVADDPGGFAAVLDDMDAETREGVRLLTSTAVEKKDPAALDVIDAFVAEQRQNSAVGKFGKNQPPFQTIARIDMSIALLDRVAARSAALRPLLTCGSGSTGEPDELGPTPKQRCSSQPGNQPSSAASGSAGSAQPSPSGVSASDKSKPGGSTSSPTTAGANGADASATPSTSVSGELNGNPTDIIGGIGG